MKPPLRPFLASSVAATGAAPLRIAPFHFEVTPPIGHPLCGGWKTPMIDCADALEAIGYVLLGAGKPIVICAVDWTGILNEAHVAWRAALAEAADTTPDRVAVQCVHQHDAPFVCLHTERLLAEQHDGLRNVEAEFFEQCLQRARAAVKAALPKARPVTHIAAGESVVERVASNRRAAIGPDGKVSHTRWSSCTEPELIGLPEGLIDPLLKTVAFYDGSQKVVACHYYATHPLSYYGQGHVTSDFAGLARKQRQQDEPGCTHIYFTGCAGNITAGKYNDGTPQTRVLLTQRIYQGIVASEKELRPAPITSVAWKTHEILPLVNPAFAETEQRAVLTDKQALPVWRILAAMRLAWMARTGRRVPIVLSALRANNIAILHLPGECFVEYQLRAQQMDREHFVATAAYGDGGPWYVPVKEAYPQGGYEVDVANCADAVDDLLTRGIRDLLEA
jgi:hypothetical protein